MFIIALYALSEITSSISVGNLDVSSRSSVARVLEFDNRAQVKYGNSLSWIDAHADLELHHRDQFFVSSNSTSLIEFNSGQHLNVLENSLIRIIDPALSDTEVGGVEIERGLVFIRLGTSSDATEDQFLLSFGGRQYRLSLDGPEEAELMISGTDDSARIQVASGNIHLSQEGSDSIQSMSSLQEVNLSAKQGEEVSELNILSLMMNLSYPSRGASLFLRPESSTKLIRFGWNKKNADAYSSTDIRLRVSSSHNFERSVFVGDVDINTTYQEIHLSAGRYYWRLEDSDGDAISTTSFFDIFLDKAPKWLSPLPVRMTLLTSQIPYILQWEDDLHQRPYELKINDEVKSVTTSSYHFDESYGPGRYELKLRTVRPNSKDENSYGPWSHVRIIELMESSLPTVIPRIPRDYQSYQVYRDHISLHFEWEEIDIADSYRVRLYMQDEVIDEFYSSQSFYTSVIDLENLSKFDGVYKFHWGVTPINTDLNLEGEESSRYKFTVSRVHLQGLSPAQGMELELKRPGETVEFEWESSEGERVYYTFEVSSDQSFSNIIKTQKTRSLNTSIEFQNVGTYYWRVRIEGEMGEYYTDPVQVIMRRPPPPKAPELDEGFEVQFIDSSTSRLFERVFKVSQKIINLIFPTARANDLVAAKTRDLSIRWEEKADISSYRIQIFEVEGPSLGETPVIDEIINQPFFIWKSASVGKYEWRLAYIDHWDVQGEFSRLYEIEVLPKEVPLSGEVNLLNPPHQLHLSVEPGIEKESERISFEWRPSFSIELDEVYSRYEIESFISFSSSLDFSRDTFLKKHFDFNKSQVYLSLSQLDIDLPSSIYWRVSYQLKERGDPNKIYEVDSLRRSISFYQKVLDSTESLEKEEREIDQTESPSRLRRFGLGYNFALFEVKDNDLRDASDNPYQIHTDGSSLVGLHLSYKSLSFETKNEFKASFNHSSAKVFEGEKFFVSDLKLLYGLNDFLWGLDIFLGPSLERLSRYDIDENERVSYLGSKVFISPQIHLRKNYQFSSFDLNFNLGLSPLGLQGPLGEVEFSSKRLGVKYQFEDLKNSSEDISLNSHRFKIIYYFNF